MVGLQEVGGKNDFTKRTLKALLIKKGNAFICPFHILVAKKFFNYHLIGIIDKDDEYQDSTRKVVRSSTIVGSDFE